MLRGITADMLLFVPQGKGNASMMTAQQVIDAIHGSYALGSKRGLRNVRELVDALCPQRRVPVIHVAGTNGKGSTCAMLESILRHAGYRTGLYTSPFLQAYQERIRLNGLPLSDELLVRYGEPLVAVSEHLQAEDDCYATPFELGTALAVSVFEGEQVDFAIVEVGMGGRLDPTNFVEPCLCAIAAIGLDHMAYLGDTLPAIAAEKAGIIKPGVPVVCHPADNAVAAVFAQAAASVHAPLHQMTQGMLLGASCDERGSRATFQLENRWEDICIPLPGEHQLTNALTVLGMVEALRRQGYVLPEKAVRQGIAATRWPARLEWCGNVLIDGAHNPQGVLALHDFVYRHLSGKKRVLLTGVLADKIQPDMLTMLANLADRTVTVTPDNPRAMEASTLAMRLNACGGHAVPASDLQTGLELARELAGMDGVVIAAGSLYFAGSLRTLLGLGWR
ncbi:MAG: bifunctional folylpolyglutamate synthase/dihydrofolate synthase [Aristaeellaceae bacterium]